MIDAIEQQTSMLTQKCPRSVWGPLGPSRQILDQFGPTSGNNAKNNKVKQNITATNQQNKRPIKIPHSYPLMGAVMYHNFYNSQHMHEMACASAILVRHRKDTRA